MRYQSSLTWERFCGSYKSKFMKTIVLVEIIFTGCRDGQSEGTETSGKGLGERRTGGVGVGTRT